MKRNERERPETEAVRPLNWGILGTGSIARLFAAALPHGSQGKLVAVASRSAVSSEAPEFAGVRHHVGYERLLADPNVEAVYIATPHPTHAHWARLAAKAGTHILCEKPIAMSGEEAESIFDAAEASGVFLLEGFMYRMHPQTAQLVQLIQGGTIGKVSLAKVEIGFGRSFDPASRLYDRALGGGAILDIGCYAMSMARLIAGAASGTPVAEPTRVLGTIKCAPNGVDEHAFALLNFPNAFTAVLSAPLSLVQSGGVRIQGDAGEIHVPSPWLCTGRTGGKSSIFVHRHGAPPEEIVFETTDWLYAIEARTFARLLRSDRRPEPPIAGRADSLGNMRALDAWRASVGVTYPPEVQQMSRETYQHDPVVSHETDPQSLNDRRTH